MSTQHVPVCTGTTRKRVSTCARGASIHGDVLNVHTVTCGVDTRREGRRLRFSSVKQVFDILEHLNRMLGSCLIANFLLTKICPHMGYHVLQRFTKEPLDLTYIENGASSIIERSALARCNVLIIRNRNTLQTICYATFAPFLSRSFFFVLFFYDDAMRGTTTQGQRPPRQRHVDNTTPHPTQPTTTRDKRHDTAPHHKKTKTHTYTHMHMYLHVHMHMSVFMYMSVSCFAHFSRKNRLEHVPSMMCTVSSL